MAETPKSGLFQLAADTNSQLNNNGGLYRNGIAFSPEKWEQAVAKYEEISNNSTSQKCTIRELAAALKCSKFFASKVIKSCESGDYNNMNHRQQDRAIGVGSLCMNLVDILTLFELRYENPYRSNKSYIKNLKRRTGTTISSATVTRFWKEIKRMLRNGSVVPMGKFSFNNRRYYAFYTRIVNNIDPTKLVFTDEKLLKGYEIYSKK